MDVLNDLTAWKALLLTARSGKVSQTSILMNLPTSKISRLLIALEQQVGYSLFDKTKRPLRPTPRCQNLLAALEPVLRDFQELQSPSFGKNKKTLIRVGAPIEGSLDFYCYDYMQYAESNNNIEFEIQPEVTEQDLRNRSVDVAMLNHLPDDPSEFKVRPIATTTTFSLATPQYLRRYGVPRCLSDLSKHRGLLLKTRTFPVTRFLSRGEMTSSALQWKSVFYTHDQFMLKKLVMNHWGITVDLYGGHVLEEIEAGDLVPFLEGWSRPRWNMCIVTRQDVDISCKEISSFADWWAARQSKTDNDRMTRSLRACMSSRQKNADLFK